MYYIAMEIFYKNRIIIWKKILQFCIVKRNLIEKESLSIFFKAWYVYTDDSLPEILIALLFLYFLFYCTYKSTMFELKWIFIQITSYYYFHSNNYISWCDIVLKIKFGHCILNTIIITECSTLSKFCRSISKDRR